jgi:LysM repeat protein
MAPAPGPAPQRVQETAPSDPATNSAYTVRSGDTLTDIARSQGTSVQELMRKNSIKNANIISVGQQLKF